MRYSKFIILTICFSLLSIVVVPQALAVGIDLKTLKPLKPVEFMPKDEFLSKTKLVEETPFEDEFLSYSIYLPKDWVINEAPFEKNMDDIEGSKDKALHNRVLGIVASYISPPTGHERSFFTLEALSLNYEIGVRDWFINYTLSEGKSLEGISEEKDNRIEAVYVEVDKDTTYIVKVVAIINGPRVVIARYYTTQKIFKTDKILQSQVIDSFELINKEDRGIEELETLGLLGQSYFDYPISWQMKADKVLSIDRMSAMMQRSSTGSALGGEIKIFLTNKDLGLNRSAALAFYKDDFGVENYKITSLIEKVPMNYHQEIGFGMTEAYMLEPTVDGMIGFEFWISMMEGEDYYYILTMLTPSRQENFYEWARNVKAFRVVVGNARRTNEDGDYYEFIR